jgi:hypothetical protein
MFGRSINGPVVTEPPGKLSDPVDCVQVVVAPPLPLVTVPVLEFPDKSVTVPGDAELYEFRSEKL